MTDLMVQQTQMAAVQESVQVTVMETQMQSAATDGSLAEQPQFTAVEEQEHSHAPADNSDSQDLVAESEVRATAGEKAHDKTNHDAVAAPVADADAEPRLISFEELAKHNTPESCWLLIVKEIYDVTSVLKWHPAGPKIILTKSGGRDAT